MMREIQKEIAETGKSERELAEIRVGAVTGIDAERAAYMKLHDELQALKDEESLEEMTEDYIEKLEELHIKKDREKNDEAQLLELQRRRALAEIEAYAASDEAKGKAIEKLNEYYDLLKETAGEEGKKEKEKDPAEAFKKRIEDELKYTKDGMKGRIDILRKGLEDFAGLEGINAEKRKEIEHELTESLKAEEESWKQVKINTALQALSAVQELTGVFGDIARQQADGRYEQETARLEADKAANSTALIDRFNEEVDNEALTGEEKENLKKTFLEKYKQNEEDYTEAVEKEEAKRKQAAVAAAIADKALSAAAAGINSFVAFTGVLAAWSEINPILAAVQAGAILASGLAQQAKIIATPISAETGGRFTVPDTGGGVDAAYMRVNAGERVDVTPRGRAGEQVTHYIFRLENQVIFDVVNRGLRSGEIYEYSPGWNIGGRG
jgi:hypothetical protein